MNSDNLKKLVKDWAAKIGNKEAIRKLIVDGEMSASMAQQLVYGYYKPNMAFDTGTVVLKILAKDGFTLSDEAV